MGLLNGWKHERSDLDQLHMERGPTAAAVAVYIASDLRLTSIWFIVTHELCPELQFITTCASIDSTNFESLTHGKVKYRSDRMYSRVLGKLV